MSKPLDQWQVNANMARERYGNGVHLVHNGQRRTITGWANALKLHPDTILSRLGERLRAKNPDSVSPDYIFRSRLTPVPDDWKDF